MADILTDTFENPIEYLRVKSEQSESPRTLASSKQTVDAFSRYIGGTEIGFDSFDETLLGEWVAYLLHNGYTLKTVSYYVKRLAALYAKAVHDHLAQATDSFSNLQAKLNAPAARYFEGSSDKETFHKLQKIVRADYTADPNKQLAKDMLLFAVFNGGLSLEEIVTCKKDDYRGGNEHILAIVNRYSKPKNKYLFPLNHSSRSTGRLVRTVEALFRDVLAGVEIEPSFIPANTALDIWCRAAMCCCFSASDIAACAGSRCGSNAVTAFVKPSGIGPDRVAEIRSRVIEALSDNPVNWYVMRFRRKVNYDLITARLKERNIHLVETYYPMEEILHKTGRKKVFETRPVISWLMFFREHASELNNLYYQIGDLAWGYRQSRDVKSPYAVISNEEMANYQRAIGTFSSEAEPYPEGAVDLRPGDRLVIIGGFFNGRPATFGTTANSSKEKGGTKTVYRILLDGGNYRDWIVDQDARLVKKITEEQFHDLRRRYAEEQ